MMPPPAKWGFWERLHSPLSRFWVMRARWKGRRHALHTVIDVTFTHYVSAQEAVRILTEQGHKEVRAVEPLKELLCLGELAHLRGYPTRP